MNKKKLPIRRKDKTESNLENEHFKKSNIKYLTEIELNKNQINQRQIFDFPEFLKKANNDQHFQSFIRMRQRHIQDGAITINIEADDIADQNIELYDNKAINIDFPHINENLAKNKEFYIESSNRNEFNKISKISGNIAENEEKPEKKLKLKHSTQLEKPKAKEIERTTEDEIFSMFDLKLTEIIFKTSNKVALIFLFTQGLLAGVSLIHLLLLFQYKNFKDFLSLYSFNVREIFNFTHSLTFASLVGNGIKFVSAYQRYNLMSTKYTHLIKMNSIKIFKKSMIFSAIILLLFSLIFAIEMYLASFIPAILYSKYTSVELISKSEFELFAVLYIICNIIAIINFILNIFDVKIEDINQSEMNRIIELNITIDEEETRDNTINDG